MKKVGISNIFNIVFTIIIVGLVYILVSCNIGTEDYIEYSNSFYGLIDAHFESGYDFLQKIFSNLGMDFDIFKMILYALTILVFIIICLKSKASIVMFMILFFIFPLAFDAAAIRNTFARTIILLFFCLNINSKILKKIVLALLIFLATLFHSMSIVYIIPLVFYIFIGSNRQEIRIVGYCFLAFFLFFSFFVLAFDNIYYDIVEMITNSDLITKSKQDYLTINGNYGYLLFALIFAMFIFILVYIKRIVKLNKIVCDKYITENLNVLLITSIVFIGTLPFIKANSNFFRIYLNVIPLIDILVLGALQTIKKHSINKYLLVLVLLFIANVSCFIIYIYVNPNLWRILFSKNWIL